jgi:hypothetical protein
MGMVCDNVKCGKKLTPVMPYEPYHDQYGIFCGAICSMEQQLHLIDEARKKQQAKTGAQPERPARHSV